MYWIIREDDIYHYLWLTDKMRSICLDFPMRYLQLAKVSAMNFLKRNTSSTKEVKLAL